jgi:hypothetical protein
MKPADWPSVRAGLLLATTPLLLSGLIAGCSSNNKPAYCTAADQLKTSVQNLGNVDIATKGLDSLKTALTSVQTSANTFASEAKSAFAPQITALQGTLSGLETAINSAQGQLSASAVAAVGSSVRQVKESAGDLATAVSDKCK